MTFKFLNTETGKQANENAKLKCKLMKLFELYPTKDVVIKEN